MGFIFFVSILFYVLGSMLAGDMLLISWKLSDIERCFDNEEYRIINRVRCMSWLAVFIIILIWAFENED